MNKKGLWIGFSIDKSRRIGCRPILPTGTVAHQHPATWLPQRLADSRCGAGLRALINQPLNNLPAASGCAMATSIQLAR
jgi:hypothetical protein